MSTRRMVGVSRERMEGWIAVMTIAENFEKEEWGRKG